MSCKRCGARLDAEVEFCGRCGAAVSGEASTQNPWHRAPAQATSAPTAEPVASTTPQAAATLAPPEIEVHAEPTVPQPAPPADAAPVVESTPAAAKHSAARVGGPVDRLLLIRLLAAVGTLAISITSYVAVKMHNPPAWLVKWGVLELPPKSEHAYQAELIILALLALLAIVVFLARSAAAQGVALLLGVGVMGIVTGNILDLNAPHQFVTYFLIQNLAITTWICLGLALMCACSAIWSAATARQVAGLLAVGTVVTGGTVAIIAAVAPTLPALFGPLG